jgi:hypothetical protein
MADPTANLSRESFRLGPIREFAEKGFVVKSGAEADYHWPTKVTLITS